MGWSITDPESLEDALIALKLNVVRRIGVRRGMTVVEVGCGQGGFTATVAKTAGGTGRVLAVDITDKYLTEFKDRLDRYCVKERVTFILADATHLTRKISAGFADMAVSFRLLEELRKSEDMPGVVREMVRVIKNGGKISLVEMSTKARNKAEEVYIRLHMESGDCFFNTEEILESMKKSGLTGLKVEKVDTNIWFSPYLAKQDLSHAQVWFDLDVQRSLGSLIDKYGMKYPKLIIFSGQKPKMR